MRKSLFLGMVMLFAASGTAFAQAGTEGPLAAPGDLPHDAAKPAKKVKHKKVAHHDKIHAPESYQPGRSDARREVGLPGSAEAADPMSFGMKWNGSSDNARETRVQNYNGGASGSGAEVGMKLHF